MNDVEGGVPIAFQETGFYVVKSKIEQLLRRVRDKIYPKESNLVKHVRSELKLIDDDSVYQRAINKHLISMAKQFSKEGHSGFSASYTIAMLEKLLRFQPITPLTGNDDEWFEYATGMFQNKRCSHVFKENGRAYDINGIIFRDKDGACYTNMKSQVDVTFPYTPSSVYVDVDTAGNEVSQ